MDLNEILEWYNTRSTRSYFALYKKIQGSPEESLILKETCASDIREGLYLYCNNTQIPICNNISCDNQTSFISPSAGYSSYCSKSCKTMSDHRNQKFNYEKSRQSFITNHGKNSPGYDKIRKKTSHTNIQKYGHSHPMKNSEYVDLHKKKIEKIYNVDNVAKLESTKNKMIETNNRVYSSDWPIQNSKILSKSRKNYIKTIQRKYGVNNVFDIPEVQAKQRENSFKSGIYEGIKYQATYELDFLIFCNQNDLLDIISDQPPVIKYAYKNKVRKYYPDFYIEKHNLIIEIKSTWWFDTYKEQNLSKQQACKDLGYEIVFIMDKNYTEFLKMLKVLEV